jgi:hypothetical protein
MLCRNLREWDDRAAGIPDGDLPCSTATLEAPFHFAASIAKFQLVLDRIRFLSGRQ